MNFWEDAIVPNNDVDGLLCARGRKVVFDFEAGMKHWSDLVRKAKDDRGAHVSDATIMIAVLALVVSIGWFVFGDAIGGFWRRI
jgi:hypothetical protein